jgi:hypothetical protein
MDGKEYFLVTFDCSWDCPTNVIEEFGMMDTHWNEKRIVHTDSLVTLEAGLIGIEKQIQESCLRGINNSEARVFIRVSSIIVGEYPIEVIEI